ncbi:hypothetical protein [Azovibrio restrictus]|uniref:hypothetical protein n=1 Tax=Azovibrio restrictus TaxID=146938 RepID=UPI0012EB80D1|nr:hypothetical protein [Azovibrio restrictus]
MMMLIDWIDNMLVFAAVTFFISLLIFLAFDPPNIIRRKAPLDPVAPTINDSSDIEYSIKHVCEGLVRAVRNGAAESAAIVTVNSKSHYFPIYYARAKWYSKKKQRFLEVPSSLFLACAPTEFMPLLAKLKAEIETTTGPLMIDLTNCRKRPHPQGREEPELKR